MDNVLDVRDKSMVGDLMNVLKNSKVTLVLIYADWCGHCKTFKEDVWSKLKEQPDRKMSLAEVNADVLSETPLASAKIDGYPSVVPIDNNLNLVTLRDESGKETNAIPNARDETMMTALVASQPGSADENDEFQSESPAVSAISKMVRSASPAAIRRKAEAAVTPPGTATPPSIEEDYASSAETLAAAETLPTRGGARGGGGALFSFLTEATQRVAPAAALAATAMIAARELKRRKSRRGRRSSRSGRKGRRSRRAPTRKIVSKRA